VDGRAQNLSEGSKGRALQWGISSLAVGLPIMILSDDMGQTAAVARLRIFTFVSLLEYTGSQFSYLNLPYRQVLR
jgi:hypothetical protein